MIHEMKLNVDFKISLRIKEIKVQEAKSNIELILKGLLILFLHFMMIEEKK